MNYRIEHDSMGDVKVPSEKLWGAQTQRSFENFKIGTEKIPIQVIHAFAYLKKAAAITNAEFGKLSFEKMDAICKCCDKIISGELDTEFPLSVWQTGSGTQSNMNVNEVIASVGCSLGVKLHPNDDVNMSQSSNDTFPTAMHISGALAINNRLMPAIDVLIETFKGLEDENKGIIKCGRTHLQDATPIAFSQEISGWRSMLEVSYEQIKASVNGIYNLALGGTAVGTGLNAPDGFDVMVAENISKLTKMPFKTASNKFHALTSKDELVYVHGALKGLACNLIKIANDIRWLASGPRLGLGEITIPANEPGSSIMPGKVNPTQCEALTMVGVQVISNDVAVGLSASQGNFELNVFMPVCIYNFLQSVNLLADAIISFNNNCVLGIKANTEKMHDNLHNSLMNVTALSPYIGYDNCAKVVKKAWQECKTLRQACIELGYLTEEKFDEVYKPENMV